MKTAVVLSATLQSGLASQIPGLVPKNFEKSQIIDIYAGELFSEKSPFRYNYYDLMWCPNKHGQKYLDQMESKHKSPNTKFEEIDTVTSMFDHKFGFDRNIQICQMTYSEKDASWFKELIKDGYHYKLYIDDLPAASILRDKYDKEMAADYFHGVPLGQWNYQTNDFVLYNHWDLVVIVHDTIDGHHRIVGFDVEPYSIAEGKNRALNDPSAEPNVQKLEAGETITYSYRVVTRVSSGTFLINFRGTPRHRGQCDTIT